MDIFELVFSTANNLFDAEAHLLQVRKDLHRGYLSESGGPVILQCAELTAEKLRKQWEEVRELVTKENSCE